MVNYGSSLKIKRSNDTKRGTHQAHLNMIILISASSVFNRVVPHVSKQSLKKSPNIIGLLTQYQN